MLDYRDISLMESVHLMWGPVTASPVGIEPMTILDGGGPVPLTVGVDFAAPLLVHVGRVEWVKVSRYM